MKALELGQELGQLEADPEKTERRNSQRSAIIFPDSPVAEPPLELPDPIATRAIFSHVCCSETMPTDIH